MYCIQIVILYIFRAPVLYLQSAKPTKLLHKHVLLSLNFPTCFGLNLQGAFYDICSVCFNLAIRIFTSDYIVVVFTILKIEVAVQ